MTLATLKQGDPTPTDNIDHLINFVAILARATKDQYGLTAEQKQVLYNRFERIYDTHPKEMLERVLEASDRKDPFWQPSSDTVLKYLHDAGILVDTLVG
jgi:hypothetical protein